MHDFGFCSSEKNFFHCLCFAKQNIWELYPIDIEKIGYLAYLFIYSFILELSKHFI
jgi:hypothetical protein